MASYYTFEDLSGSSVPNISDNPYQDLIAACHNDPAQIQARYHTHRVNRNAQQRAKMLSPEFNGVVVDEILARLENPSIEPGFVDWRNCLVFWARPPQKVRDFISEVQQKLLRVVPNLWIMPPSNLHMTALEVTHSLTAQEIEELVRQMLPHVPEITDYTLNHRARLFKPMLSFDAQALALSYLPAVAEVSKDDCYTYHHLRRDLFTKVSATGVKVASRYVIPSAHLTIGRFITKTDFEIADGTLDPSKVEKLITLIDEINAWLEKEYWPTDGGHVKDGGEWIVGEEKGLECRKGTLWYGDGETIHLGKGF